MHGIHSVFPPPAATGHSGAEPILVKKLINGEGVWTVKKEILRWIMNGTTICMELADKKHKLLLK